LNKSASTEIQDRFERILAEIRQPARLIGGEWGSGPGFHPQAEELRVVLGFPDTYEIGISNQALQVLYHLAAATEGVAVERTYLPWVDALAAMRRDGVPLLTVETFTPVASADLLGLTLQHEFDYTNVLEMLDAAGIPLHAADRTGEHPLVIAGGPACANFLPVAQFFDAIAVGDGEVTFPEILQTMLLGKSGGTGREALKHQLSEIEGVWVPGISHGVERRAVTRLRDAPYPDRCLVPLTAGIHDRAWIEIMRGCTRGCRFCQAGMWYRPVRERAAEQILTMATAQLRESGHQELAFASLSTTDYSGLTQILNETAVRHPEARVSLPSLRVDSASVRLAQLASPTGPSLTLAPEAGSERMWRAINKNVTREDVLAAAVEAFAAGRTTLKLYFMIGLPLEEEDDVIAIADLCHEIRRKGREVLGPRANRLQLNVSINNFIPKPFTPFQWTGMPEREILLRRQHLLRSRLRGPGIKLTLHDVDKSYLEAALARGGEEMGAVIEAAWRGGARFDSWTEEHKPSAWAAALAEAGTSVQELATSAWPRDALLPWEVITGVVERDFLWAEWEKAWRGEQTPDCRRNACSACGACEGDLANDLAGTPCAPGAAPEAGTSGPASGGRRWRYLATLSVTDRGRFIGHLDRAEILRRAIRRAGGHLALSAGMRPKPQLSLALPLAVGVEGLEELCEFELQHEPSPEFASRLAAALPAHMTLAGVEEYGEARPAAARVTGARYDVSVIMAAEGRDQHEADRVLAGAADRFACTDKLPIEERRGGKVRTVDVKMYVERVQVVPRGPVETVGSAVNGEDGEDRGFRYSLVFEAAVTPIGTARPEKVATALALLAGAGLRIEAMKRLGLVLT
jgi:radical SAM family uncharacterized protein/radical SAM-linked protein